MNAQDLKNSILQLSIQGKLVEQRKEEGTAKELLEQIKAEKELLIKEKKIKKENPLPEITGDEIPFDIPESWEWVRHNEIFEVIGGSQPPKSYFKEIEKENYVRLYQIRDYGDRPSPVYVPKNKVTKFTNKGDILLARYGASIGKVFWAENGAYNVAMAKSTPQFKSELVNRQYLYYYYLSSLYQNLVRNNSRSAQAGFNKDDLAQLLLPIPPVEEQKRIVAKIEYLMPYIEKYGEAQSKLEVFNKKFPEDMQKSILQYSIQGKLVEQREEEGTAEELYQQIQEEKAKLIKEGKIKKEKPLAEITEDEIPFEIPDSWKWVRLGSLFNVSTGMTPLKSNPLFHENGDIPWITSSQTGELRIKRANNFITRFAIESTSLKIYPKHTLLIAMYGQGKTRGQISKLLIDATINQACAALENIIDDENLRNYILYFQMYNYDVSRTGAEGSAQPNLNLDKIRNILLPLPPLAEQKRIVAKIEELMPYCQQLVK